jgi:hypothetical protein
MYTPSQLRLLKIAVIAMGVILLLGFATVIGRIVWLVNSAPRSSVSGDSTAATPLAPPAPILLPKGATIRHLAISGSRLAVHYEGPDGGAIRIIDLGPAGASVTLPVVEAGR